MIIHVVQPDDTIFSIAKQYNISTKRLEQDNNLSPNNILNIGQALMISYPERTYIVKEGDTLSSIAQTQGVPLKQLQRNNPQLTDRVFLSTGEEIIISYPTTENKIKVIGYTTTYINLQVLKTTLPFLTYLTIYNFKVTANGNFVDLNDTEIIQLAKQYGVRPIMFLSALTEQGKGSYGITHSIISNEQVQDRLIDKVLTNMKLKGYYGLNLAFHNILPEDLTGYVNFIANVTTRLNSEGFEVFVTLTPFTMQYKIGIQYKNTFFTDIGQIANNIILISYLWAAAEISQVAETTVDFLAEYLSYVATQIPPEKIFIGLTRIAYNWELPYVPGDSIGTSLTNSGAINLANQLGVSIQFNERTQTPYFYYTDAGIEHYVWFKDSRSIKAILNLVDEYDLKGIAIWNIMYYNSPTWLSINSQFDIETIEDNFSEF